MKSKQEKHPAAKQQPTQSAKARVSRHTATVPTSNSDVDDVANLFSAIKQTKARQKGTGSTAAGANGASSLFHTGNNKRGKNSAHCGRNGAASVAASSSSSSTKNEAKPARDGLYHAPQKSVQMSDTDFFSGTWLKADQAAVATAGGSGLVMVGGGGNGADFTEASQELLRKEGVDRIVSMEELSKMLSRSARAGTTPNCPFDCDCCF